MNAEELLVHEGCERESAEGVCTGLVDSFGVFMLALKSVSMDQLRKCKDSIHSSLKVK